MKSSKVTRRTSIGFLLCFSVYASAVNGASIDELPGLGDPGALQQIVIETGRQDKSGMFVVAGRDASQQLVVTGIYSTKQVRDLSRAVKYTTSSTDIVKVDETGWLEPIKEGQVTIHVSSDQGVDASIQVKVTNIEIDIPVNFPNQVVPIFTKYGCNSGGCHGKSGGQNGFALSLLGFEPTEDYEYLVKEARGRRVFPAAPDQSLLLLKAVGKAPHGGGARIEFDSPPYRLMKRWIEQGLPYGSDDDPTVTHIEIFPIDQMMDRETTQQIISIAHYSDGSTEDVTRMTKFESNDTEMADVSVTGIVTTGQLPGSVAIMARYQGQVGVFRAKVPLGLKLENLPPVKNYIDEKVFNNLTQLGLPASTVSSDSVFLRRVTIDVAGRMPSQEEVELFLADKDADKRAKLIDRLLASVDYANNFANKWSTILRNKRSNDNEKYATFAFHNWIVESLHENKPYDQFVGDVLSASGKAGSNPPVAWYREVKDQTQQLEDTAQLFLGLRIQCARCHHHPFEKWSQEDYYGFSAFFSRVGRKKAIGLAGGNQSPDSIYHKVGKASAKNPKSGNTVLPTGLGSEPMIIAEDRDPRVELAKWLAKKENPFFAPALVNRYWKHFFGRGLVDPEDDMRVTNPSSNPELLNALAEDFKNSGFDMKHLVRTICNSSTYQLTAEPNAYNQNDKQNFSRYYPKRLPAEILLDAIDQVTGTETRFSGMPGGVRAIELPDNNFNSYFLTVFGRPESSSACECERSGDANLAQSLHLLNSSEIQGKLTNGGGVASKFASDKEREIAAKIRQLYLLAFSREPAPEEIAIARGHIEKPEQDPKQAYEDIVWALINTKEFLFNH
ncbi:MAG: DUF1549 domain-containing protein [Pirellulales bacterium]